MAVFFIPQPGDFCFQARIKHVGEHLHVKLLRDRQTLDLSYELRVRVPLVGLHAMLECCWND